MKSCWFEDALRIISTFVESYNFKGKTVVTFCMSGLSGIGKIQDATANTLKAALGSREWR